MLVTCIFLNRTPAARARRFLLSFLEGFPTPEALRDADPGDIRREYFATLGLARRADWLVRMATELIDDPSPDTGRNPTDVPATLRSWATWQALETMPRRVAPFLQAAILRRPCIDIADEWQDVHPHDWALRRYVVRRSGRLPQRRSFRWQTIAHRAWSA